MTTESHGREQQACSQCEPTKFNAERMDVWRMAYATLTNKEEFDWDTEPVTPRDVMALAIFLTGTDPSDL